MKKSDELYVDLPALRECCDRDYRVLDVYRENMVTHVREFVGSHYSDYTNRPESISTNGSEYANPVNLLSLFVRVVTDYLCGSDPRMMSSTFTREYRPFVSALEDWGNRRLVQMDFADVYKTAITDAVFLMAWVKTSLTKPAEARFGNGKVPGELSITNIPFQDMVFDTRAKKFSECDYIGHEYDVFLEDVKQSPLFDKAVRKEVQERRDTMLTETGGMKIEQVGRAGMSYQEEYEPKCRLREIWLRRQNIVVTFDAYGDAKEPLLVQKFIGPYCGPYDWFSLCDVPGNLIPKGPILDLIDMHKSFNLLWTKLDWQASRAKKITLYRDAGEMKRIQDTPDGGTVQSEDPKGTAELAMGGPDPNTANWTMQSYEMFSKYAGNLNSLGGLGSQTNTATQEKLVHDSASNLVRAMSERATKFAEKLMNKAGWYFWMSPRDTMRSTYHQPGLPDISIERKATPRDRFGIPYEEINVKMDPYSILRQTPQMRLQQLDELVQKWIIPVLPLFNQPGIGELLAEAIRMKAKYSNNPDLIVLLEKLQQVQGPPEGSAGPEASPQPAPATTTHERVSRSGMTDQGHSQVLQQLMAGGQPGQGSMGSGLGQMGNLNGKVA